MRHLNGNILCVVDVETTGTNPLYHDLTEVCVLPLDIDLSPSSRARFFNVDIVPLRPDNIDMEAIRIQKKVAMDGSSDKILSSQKKIDKSMRGLDNYRAADLFLIWFEKLKLAPGKRIMPIAHNWVFDQAFLKEWLGVDTFEYCFDPRFRDTMAMSLYENDRSDWRGEEEYPYPRNSLSLVSRRLKLPHFHGHTAFDDCIATAKVYKKMIQRHC